MNARDRIALEIVELWERTVIDLFDGDFTKIDHIDMISGPIDGGRMLTYILRFFPVILEPGKTWAYGTVSFTRYALEEAGLL